MLGGSQIFRVLFEKNPDELDYASFPAWRFSEQVRQT